MRRFTLPRLKRQHDDNSADCGLERLRDHAKAAEQDCNSRERETAGRVFSSNTTAADWPICKATTRSQTCATCWASRSRNRPALLKRLNFRIAALGFVLTRKSVGPISSFATLHTLFWLA